MWTPPTLIEFYDYIVVLQQPTSIIMKLSMIAGLLLMAREPGMLARQLLTWIFAAHFLSAAFLASGGAGGTNTIMLTSLALAILCGAVAYFAPPDWKVLPEGEAGTIAACFAYFLLIFFPFWPMLDGAFRSLVYSPMGILPHQSLGVLLLLLALGGTRHRGVLSVAAILAGLLIGLVDLIWAYGFVGGLLFAGSAVTAYRVYPRELGGILLDLGSGEAETEDDRPTRSAPRKEDAPPPRPTKQAGKPAAPPSKKAGGRKWDL